MLDQFTSHKFRIRQMYALMQVRSVVEDVGAEGLGLDSRAG